MGGPTRVDGQHQRRRMQQTARSSQVEPGVVTARGQYRGMEFTERDWIRFGDAVIDYQIKRSTRRHKTMEISAGPSGVRVAVPAMTPTEEVAAFVRNKARWILAHTAAPRAAPELSELPNSLPYLGRQMNVAVSNECVADADVRFRPWDLQVFLPLEADEASALGRARCAVAEWYWLRAREHVAASVDRWWPDLGRDTEPEIHIGDQRKRWGSCAADGRLRFNWRLVMLAPRLMDYVVVHELAHLTEQNHGPAFWALVESVLPDVAERKRALRSAERALPM